MIHSGSSESFFLFFFGGSEGWVGSMAENRWFIVAGISYFKSGVLGKVIGPRKAHVTTEQWSSVLNFFVLRNCHCMILPWSQADQI